MEREKTRVASPRDENAVHRAALEALFAPKVPAAIVEATINAPRAQAKIVSLRARVADPDRALHEKLLGRFLGAEGTAAVERAAAECARAGFTLPDDQNVCLKMLDHPDEARVRDALSSLMRILVEAAPRRRAVLDARLRRLEDDAEELATREQATALRRKMPPRDVC